MARRIATDAGYDLDTVDTDLDVDTVDTVTVDAGDNGDTVHSREQTRGNARR